MLYPLGDAAGAKSGFWIGEAVMLLYSALLALALIVRTFFYLKPMLAASKDREELRQRAGRVPATLVQAVAGKRVLWVHAVSVGEVLAASRLIGELEAALGAASGETWRVVISTTTRTGQALARERFGAERVFYFPLDFAHAVRPYLEALQPAAVVLMESEVWPRMMYECRRRRIPVIVVNARVSDRSFSRSKWVRWIWSRVLRRATLWLAQSEEDARRLVAMGARPECVRAIGNLKYDVRAPKDTDVVRQLRGIAANRPVLVAGSTVSSRTGEDDEEHAVIATQQECFPGSGSVRPLLVLAPRHPERFGAVEAMLQSCRYVRASDWRGNCEPAAAEVVLLDTIGDLAAAYALADVAFVGGSLVKRGGHNPLEPAQFAAPVVMGPSFENFRGVVETMREAHAIRVVEDEDDFDETIINLFSDRTRARSMGERGRRVFEEQQGATGRAVQAIVALVRGGAAA